MKNKETLEAFNLLNEAGINKGLDAAVKSVATALYERDQKIDKAWERCDFRKQQADSALIALANIKYLLSLPDVDIKSIYAIVELELIKAFQEQDE